MISHISDSQVYTPVEGCVSSRYVQVLSTNTVLLDQFSGSSLKKGIQQKNCMKRGEQAQRNEHVDAKIADFGLSMVFSSDNGTCVVTSVMGTADYLGPEYYGYQRLNEKFDVCSLLANLQSWK